MSAKFGVRVDFGTNLYNADSCLRPWRMRLQVDAPMKLSYSLLSPWLFWLRLIQLCILCILTHPRLHNAESRF